MAGGEGNNPKTTQVEAGGGVLGRAFDNLGRGTVFGGLVGNNRPEVRQQEDVATPEQQEAAAARLKKTRLDHQVAQNPGAVQPQRRTTAPTERRSLETIDVSPRGGGGGAAGRPVYNRGQVNWKEGAEEFRKRQARSLEYAAIENVRAAEATEDYYENVAIARRDAAAVFKGEADSMGALKDRALTESLEQAQRVQAVARKVGAFSPRPGRLFADASGAASFGAALSLAAGAMESARSGGPNVALGIINNAIKRDVAAQELELEGMKAELQAEATVFQEIRAAYGDAITAQKAQMAAEQEAAVMYLQAQMDQYMGPVKKAQLMAVAHQMQAQSNNTLIEMSERTYQTITNHKKGQVMADMKKLNIEGTWNQRDMSYDEFQQELYLRAAGEESEAASAEEQGAALAEQRLRKAQAQAEEAAALEVTQTQDSTMVTGPVEITTPAAEAPTDAPAPAGGGGGRRAGVRTGPVEIVAPEGSRPDAPAEGSLPEVGPITIEGQPAEEAPAPESQVSIGEPEVMTDEETSDFAHRAEMEQPDPEPTLDITELEGEVARLKNTRSRRSPRLGADIRRVGSKKVLAEAERAMGGYYVPKGAMARAANNSDSNTAAAANALVALTQYGRYDRAPKGSGKEAWLDRSTGLERGYRGSINPAETGGAGIPYAALAEGRGKPSREQAAKFGERVGGRGNGEFWLPGVAENATVVPIRIEGTGQTVSVPVTSGVPIYYNKGAYAAGAPEGKIRSGAQNQGNAVGSNPYAPPGSQKMYAKADATDAEVKAATNLLANSNTLINGTYAVEVFNKLFGSEAFAGGQLAIFSGFEVTPDQMTAALEGAGIKDRWRRAAVAKQLGYDLSKKGPQQITLNSVKTLAGKVSHMEGFKTPQKAELILSREALGAEDVSSIFDIGGWMKQFAGTNSASARAYRARIEEAVNGKLTDGTLQPEVSYEAALKRLRAQARGTAEEGREPRAE